MITYSPITITSDNYRWAIAENFRLAYVALGRCWPVNGYVRLEGDIDFSTLATVRGVSPYGPRSGYSLLPSTKV